MKHSDVKQHIIETASNLFYKNGYNRTGINEIIATAEIAKATLYNHFKSKEDICLAYLQHMNVSFLKDIKAYCAKKEDGQEHILGIFDFLLQFFKSEEFNGCWCIKTVAEIPMDDERIRTEIQTQKIGLIKVITEMINIHLSDHKANTENLARQIYLLYESAVAESHLHQNKWPIEEAKNLCIKILN